MDIKRWNTQAVGRSQTVALGPLLWTVANARDRTADFAAQTAETFARLNQALVDAGSSRAHLLSVQVLLLDMKDRIAFDALWCEWVGPNPQHWPQRSCFQATLAPGLLLELVVTAARTEDCVQALPVVG